MKKELISNLFKKAVEGDIIGFAAGDDGISSNPLTWLIAHENDTEILFLSQEDFAELWNLQNKNTELQIVIK
jgi:hypothetical protein